MHINWTQSRSCSKFKVAKWKTEAKQRNSLLKTDPDFTLNLSKQLQHIFSILALHYITLQTRITTWNWSRAPKELTVSGHTLVWKVQVQWNCALRWSTLTFSFSLSIADRTQPTVPSPPATITRHVTWGSNRHHSSAPSGGISDKSIT